MYLVGNQSRTRDFITKSHKVLTFSDRNSCRTVFAHICIRISVYTTAKRRRPQGPFRRPVPTEPNKSSGATRNLKKKNKKKCCCCLFAPGALLVVRGYSNFGSPGVVVRPPGPLPPLHDPLLHLFVGAVNPARAKGKEKEWHRPGGINEQQFRD